MSASVDSVDYGRGGRRRTRLSPSRSVSTTLNPRRTKKLDSVPVSRQIRVLRRTVDSQT